MMRRYASVSLVSHREGEPVKSHGLLLLGGAGLISVIFFCLATRALATHGNPDSHSVVMGLGPCGLTGTSYAAPSSGYISWTQSTGNCSDASAPVEVYGCFWNGSWSCATVIDPYLAARQTTNYSAATEGWHEWGYLNPPMLSVHTYGD